VIAPLAPDTYKIQFAMSREMHDRFRRAQDLLRHVSPSGDAAVVFDRALLLLLADLEKAIRGDRATACVRSVERTLASYSCFRQAQGLGP
jgi:hypothetical protein